MELGNILWLRILPNLRGNTESPMRIKLLKILMLLGALFLAACGSATPISPTTAPTADLNLLRTEVAATVLAQVPALCELTPTATQIPTSTPTRTPTVEQTPTLAAVVITGTPGTPGASTGDRAKWVSQSIQDGTRFNPGEEFTMVWRLQNSGITTWTSGYRLRFFTGNALGAAQEIQLTQDVAPNETIDITVPMRAPTQTGTYRSDWVMSNESRYNFNEPVFLEIIVSPPSTATATATQGPTATVTITMELPTATVTNTPSQ
jgi:hypothetical protein